MKKLLVFITLALCFTAKAQDSTKLTAKYIYEDVKAGFSKLVSTLQGPALHVYKVYVKQYQAEGTLDFVLMIVLIGFFGGFFTWGMLTRDPRVDLEEPTKLGVFVIICGIITLVTFIVILCGISTSYTKMTNPEYYAIQDILKTFK